MDENVIELDKIVGIIPENIREQVRNLKITEEEKGMILEDLVSLDENEMELWLKEFKKFSKTG